MKDLMKMMMALVACAVMFTACGDPDDDNQGGGNPDIAVPTNLTVTDVTHEGATLNWEGTETTFEVTVNGKTEVVTAKTYVVTGLAAETNYTWKVRTKKDAEFSAYVDGPAFTTALAKGAKITFDGATWTANVLYGNETDEGAFWLGLMFANDDMNAYPYTRVWPAPALGENIFLDPAVEEQFFFYATAEDRLLQNSQGQIIGDWMFKEGTYTQTAYSLNGISATFDLVLFDGVAKYIDNVATPEEKTLDIAIVDLPLTALPSAKMAEMSRKNISSETYTLVK